MYDVVTIGSALLDAFLSIHEVNNYCRINRETGELCVKAGAKIPLESAQFELGGNASNVAVGLSRLGLHAALLAEMGHDMFSHLIRKQLENEHVGLNHLITGDTPSSLSIAINFKGERTLFTHHVIRSHYFSYDSIKTKWIYLTSIGEKWKHIYREVPAFVKRSGCKLAFNPGSRQINAERESIEAALDMADILFVNKEEAITILNIKDKIENSNHEIMRKLLNGLQELGVETAVITDGEHGAFALDSEGNFYKQPIIHAPVVERTGAGDSFSSGFLAAIAQDFDIQTAMLWGALNAASVIGKVGAQAGLLTKEEMEHRVSKV